MPDLNVTGYGGTGSDSIWVSWASNTTNVTTASTSSDVIWGNWNNQITAPNTGDVTSSSTGNTLIWQSWAGQQTSSNVTMVNDQTWGNWQIERPLSQREYEDHVLGTYAAPAPETPEQVQERLRRAEQRARENEARWAKQRQERAQAKRRAKKLLGDHLTERQQRQLKKKGYFEVCVQGRTFRIHNNAYHQNIVEVDKKGKKLREFCAHTSQVCPNEDHHLAQKLMIECALEDFEKIANVWDLQKSGRPIISRSGVPLVH